MTKVAEIRDQSVDQLADQLAKLKKEQFNLRFQRASGQLENTARFRVVRHDIARILTVLGERGAKVALPQAAGGEAAKAAKPRSKKKAAVEKAAKDTAEKPKKRASARAKKE